jgi:dolichyl-phosphate beta-glucosyltransferase
MACRTKEKNKIVLGVDSALGGESSGRDVLLSLVVPCFNEASILASSVKTLDYFLYDGSTDSTQSLLYNLTQSLLYHRIICYSPNHGKGAALKVGFREAHGKYCAFCDADLAVDLKLLPLLLDAVRSGNDAAIASKWHPRAQVQYPYWRRWLSRLNSILLSRIVGMKIPLYDLQCGMKLFCRSSCWQTLVGAQQNGWLWDAEVLIRLYRQGRHIVEIPAILKHQLDNRSSRIFSVRSILQIVRDYWHLRRPLR